MENMIARIEQLKQEKDVAIVAHYYVDGQVQDIADYVGDSFALSKIATTVPQKNILFCGVLFMGESAKTLNPKKTVMMPDLSADCPMAHMVTVEDILDVKEKYPDVAVVCYVNSTAEIKAPDAALPATAAAVSASPLPLVTSPTVGITSSVSADAPTYGMRFVPPIAFTLRARMLFFSSIRESTCLFRRPISLYKAALSVLSVFSW